MKLLVLKAYTSPSLWGVTPGIPVFVAPKLRSKVATVERTQKRSRTVMHVACYVIDSVNSTHSSAVTRSPNTASQVITMSVMHLKHTNKH
jgi:hypothetical protein